MAFTDLTLEKSWERADGKCECTNKEHGWHGSPHGEELSWGNRGRPGLGAWEAYSIGGKTLDSPEYCRIFCWRCFKSS